MTKPIHFITAEEAVPGNQKDNKKTDRRGRNHYLCPQKIRSIPSDASSGQIFQRRAYGGRLVFWGGLVTLLYAVLSTGVYHPDEHFQILEYAHMKLFGKPAPEQLPWEYGLKMRPGFQPMIAYAVGKLLLFAGVYSPHLLALLLRLFSGALSMWAVWSFGRRPFAGDGSDRPGGTGFSG